MKILYHFTFLSVVGGLLVCAFKWKKEKILDELVIRFQLEGYIFFFFFKKSLVSYENVSCFLLFLSNGYKFQHEKEFLIVYDKVIGVRYFQVLCFKYVEIILSILFSII